MSATGHTPLSWERVPGADLLKGWVAELKAACAEKDEREWRDVGRAVILVADDFDRVEAAARKVAVESGMNFLNVDSADVIDLAPRSAFRSQAPALLYLGPGNWLQPKQEDDSDEWIGKKEEFHKRLVQWINEFDVAKPIVLVTGCSELGDMSGVIDRPGCFDRYLSLPDASVELVGQEFLEELGHDRCHPELLTSVSKLGKFLKQGYSRKWRRDSAILFLRRLNRRTQRLIEFTDLVHMSLHGFGEESQHAPDDNDKIRRQTAIHEAGHAVMAIVESGGEDFPEYCSIMPGPGFDGVMGTSVNYYFSLATQTTYHGFRHDIRVDLAGRAAEELVFGIENVSSGACGDLKNATKNCQKAFARWGFAPGMTDAASSASNLAVIVGDPSPTEQAHVEGLIRKFLADEYAFVLATLDKHRAFLDALADRLIWDPVVDQSELAELACKHSIAIQAA